MRLDARARLQSQQRPLSDDKHRPELAVDFVTAIFVSLQPFDFSVPEALDKLRSDQHTLLRLFDFITASPDRETVH